MKKLCLALCTVLLAAGCQNPLHKPAQGICETILPEYEAYVEKDASLSDVEKRIRLLNSKAFKKLLEEYDKSD